MRVTTTALIVFSTFAINIASAELKTIAPPEICTYMKTFDLATQGWKVLGGNIFACGSQMKNLGESSSLTENPNNITFFVQGDNTVANKAELILNVNNRGTAETAHNELLKASEILTLKATGVELPKGLKDAIKTGKKANAKIGSFSVEVDRDTWPTGKGYEVKVTIK